MQCNYDDTSLDRCQAKWSDTDPTVCTSHYQDVGIICSPYAGTYFFDIFAELSYSTLLLVCTACHWHFVCITKYYCMYLWETSTLY